MSQPITQHEIEQAKRFAQEMVTAQETGNDELMFLHVIAFWRRAQVIGERAAKMEAACKAAGKLFTNYSSHLSRSLMDPGTEAMWEDLSKALVAAGMECEELT